MSPRLCSLKMSDTSKDELLLGGGIGHITATLQYHAQSNQVPACISNIQGDHCPDNVKFSDIFLMVCGTPSHKCYSYHACTKVIVSGGGRNATVHDPKPMHKLSKVKTLLKTSKYAANNKQF